MKHDMRYFTGWPSPQVVAWSEGYKASRQRLNEHNYNVPVCPYTDPVRRIQWLDGGKLAVEEDIALAKAKGDGR